MKIWCFIKQILKIFKNWLLSVLEKYYKINKNFKIKYNICRQNLKNYIKKTGNMKTQ